MKDLNAHRKARIAWSYIAEMRDSCATQLIELLGVEEAWDWVAFHPGEVPGKLKVHPHRKKLLDLGQQWHIRAQEFEIDRVLSQAERTGIDFVMPGDRLWPQLLVTMNEWQPIGLWVRGNTDALSRIDTKSVSIVGCRASSSYGNQIAAEIAFELGSDGYTIVSGGAFGIDAMAHQGCLRADGVTIAALAGGLDRFYPVSHTQLFEQILRQGLLVSMKPPGARPTRWRFLDRNRLIAGLSQGTVVIEAGFRSGALNTAHHARDLGRHLGAVPGSAYSNTSFGCHQLIRENATLVTSAAEVRQMLEPIAAVDDAIHSRDGYLPTFLDQLKGDEKIIFDALPLKKATTLERVARAAGLSIEKAQISLAGLEFNNYVSCSDGLWRRNIQPS